MTTFHYGENLRKLRQSKGISQEAVAMYLNISQATYSRIECQQTTTNYHQIFEIAKFLDVPASQLLSTIPSDIIQENNNITKLENAIAYRRRLLTPLTRFVIFFIAFCIVVPQLYIFSKELSVVFGASQSVTLFISGVVAIVASIILHRIVKRL